MRDSPCNPFCPRHLPESAQLGSGRLHMQAAPKVSPTLCSPTCHTPGPLSYACTERELLSMRLPRDRRSPEGVTEDRLEDASEAGRARPTQVQVWEQYDGQPLDSCIMNHVAAANNTIRRCAALSMARCPTPRVAQELLLGTTACSIWPCGTPQIVKDVGCSPPPSHWKTENRVFQHYSALRLVVVAVNKLFM